MIRKLTAERDPYLFVNQFQYLVLLAVHTQDCRDCIIPTFLTALLHVLYSQQGNMLQVPVVMEQYGCPKASWV